MQHVHLASARRGASHASDRGRDRSLENLGTEQRASKPGRATCARQRAGGLACKHNRKTTETSLAGAGYYPERQEVCAYDLPRDASAPCALCVKTLTDRAGQGPQPECGQQSKPSRRSLGMPGAAKPHASGAPPHA